MYPCNFMQAGKQWLEQTGIATSIVSLPLSVTLEHDVDMDSSSASSDIETPTTPEQPILRSAYQHTKDRTAHSAGSLSFQLPAFVQTVHAHELSESPTSSLPSPPVKMPSPITSERLSPVYSEDSHSTSTPCSSASDNSDESGKEAPLPLGHLHLITHHPPDTRRVSFPIICVAPHTEIYGLLVSTLLHRRLYGVVSPVLGLAFDPMESRLQVVYGWLVESSTHKCVRCSFFSSSLDV